MTRKKILGRPTGHCKVCAHTDRLRAELLVVGGAGCAAVARKLGMGKHSLFRHMRNHVTAERKSAMVLGPTQRLSLTARVSEESESIIDHHRSTRAGLLQTYVAAIDAGDRVGVALLAGRLTEVNNAIARLTGQLANSPLITNNTQVNNFAGETIDYDRLKRALEGFGRIHPEVFPALCDMIATLDSPPTPTEPTGLLIEHAA